MNTYELLAKYYEHIMDDFLYATYLERILYYTKPTQTLDLGCGTAYLSRKLSEKGYSVDAVDNSEEILEVANHYAVLENLSTIQFYKQDMTETFNKMYGLIIASVDVINHAKDESTMKQIIDNLYDHLIEGGYLLIDFLKCEYIKKMDGYEETILLDDTNIIWHVEKGDKPCSVVHTIQIDDHHATHQEFSIPRDKIQSMLSAFKLVECMDLEERRFFIFKK